MRWGQRAAAASLTALWGCAAARRYGLPPLAPRARGLSGCRDELSGCRDGLLRRKRRHSQEERSHLLFFSSSRRILEPAKRLHLLEGVWSQEVGCHLGITEI